MDSITEKVMDELTSNLANYLDEIIFKFLFTTVTGIAILIITMMIVFGMIIMSSQLGKIAKNQEVIFAQLKEQMITQNDIRDILAKKENQLQYQRQNTNIQQHTKNFNNN